MKKLSIFARPSLVRASLTTGLSLAAAITAVGCSDDARIPQGGAFSFQATGIAGVVLIDDMEDGNQYILSDNGLNGLWYIYNDESAGSAHLPEVGFPMTRNGSIGPARVCADPNTPVFAGETACDFVAHTSGGGQRGWGAGIGLDFNGDGGVKNPVDATLYAGIGFFARGNTRNGTLRVKVQDASSTPESALAADTRGINRCETLTNGVCADHFGFNITGLTDQWQWFAIPWTSMSTEGYGFVDSNYQQEPAGLAPAGLHLEALVGMQFQIQGADPADTGTPSLDVLDFEFSIDNLGFVESFGPIVTPTP